MTTEEIVQGLAHLRERALLSGDYAILDAAIERLRFYVSAEAEWPKVYLSQSGDVRVYVKSAADGLFSLSGKAVPIPTSDTVCDCVEFGDELLTGPARAEVLERLGIKVGA